MTITWIQLLILSVDCLGYVSFKLSAETLFQSLNMCKADIQIMVIPLTTKGKQ